MKMNSILGKKILALVRGGDYAHPGEEDAIDMVFRNISKNPNNLLLDAGCGIGGTADYLEKKGYGKVTGIDIDAENIDYAKEKYPHISFVRTDVVEVDKVLKEKFDVLYLLTSFYAFPDKQKALESLRKVAKVGAKLIIFDYAKEGKSKYDLNEISDPLNLDVIESMVEKAGWCHYSCGDISDYFTKTYQNLVEKIKLKKEEIERLAGTENFKYVLGIYTSIYEAYKKDLLKGVIIEAEAI